MLTIRLFAAASVCRFRQFAERADRRGLRGHEIDPRRPLAEHRLDLVRRVAGVAQVAAQALVDEVLELGPRILHGGHAREGAERGADEVGEGHAERLLDDDADHADRVAAKAERVLVAGRLRADAEHAGERLELVGERDRLRHRTLRQRVAREARPVVLLDRRRDRRRLAVVLRVVAAHQALQLGKFADHVGGEIGLGELRGARALAADPRRSSPASSPRQPREPRDAIELRSELVVIDDRGEARHARLEPHLAVLVEEEPGIGEPRPQHPLVAVDDRARDPRVSRLLTTRKRGTSLPSRLGEREVLLVLLHRQDEALLRHREERRIERAFVHGRRFDERRHFVEQRIRHDDGRARRGAAQAGDDRRAALGERGDDLAFGAQRLLVGVRRRDRGCRRGSGSDARPSARSAARPSAAHRDDVRAVEREQPVRRPDELDVVVVAAGARIAHHLRDRQLADRLVERVLQAADERLTLGEAPQVDVVGLAVGGDVECRRARLVASTARGRRAPGVRARRASS